MRKIKITYRLRLYPKPEQENRLMEVLELCRKIYNYFLSQWNGKEKILSISDLQAQLPG